MNPRSTRPHQLSIIRSIIPFVLLICLGACQATQQSVAKQPLEDTVQSLKNYDSLAVADVMVVGTFHFGEQVLGEEEQASIEALTAQLAAFDATKILVEWEPHRNEETNAAYRDYVAGKFDISDRSNEVFQLGFRLAAALGHEAIYLFDDQTDYPGSLTAFSTEDDPFSFDLFNQYAMKEDAGFYDQHAEILESNFSHNRSLMQQLSVAEHVTLLNSPAVQNINRQRMHMYEMRIGIQKNWSGPDWLGRWYRRNIRMLANSLKIAEDGDRLLIIVGDNHKWVLDQMYDATPDFNLVSSWELFSAEWP